MNRSNPLARYANLAACAALTLQVASAQAGQQSPAAARSSTPTTDDPYLWLEDVTGDRSLQWARDQNAITTRELEASADFEQTRQRLLSILDSKERIPYVNKYGEYYYNFWRDQDHVRGLLRRTTLEEYRKANPAWETVIDLDQLATDENENWVWKGYNVLHPTFDRCLVYLSRGGADAKVTREFDLEKKAFIQNGFFLPEAKSRVDWRNRDTLYIATDFGPGSLTDSGYPRIVKEWQRDTPIAEAKTVFEGKAVDVAVGASVVHDHGRIYEFIGRSPTFFTDETLLRRGDQWVKIDKPDDAEVRTFADELLIQLRTDWNVGGTTYPGGALLAANLQDYLKGERRLEVLFEPTERKSLAGTSETKNYLILQELENVRSRLYALKYDQGPARVTINERAGTVAASARTRRWQKIALETPEFGNVMIEGIDPERSDDYFMTVADFLTPSSLYLGAIGKRERDKLKSLPAFFDATGLEIEQHAATSNDGTKVPYFQVSRKNISSDGRNPTLLYGYGGFEIPMLPNYNASVGSTWLERGGVYVLANIRGGGEFGPRWHQAARKQNRQRAYDDFIAVAEDLIRRKVTSPERLGIHGGSNGGLLVGVMLTQRPDLFKAVVCQVPLLDMYRFNKLLAGASWMDEYGNPDQPEEWAFISKYSPYQNVKRDKKYPRTLFTTSTRDDRVHPGHARKMVARMKEQDHDVLYYENIEGGHGGAANNKQMAYMAALAYTFLRKELGLP